MNGSSFNTGRQIDASIAASAEAVASIIAPLYDPALTYPIGAAVRRDGALWVCVVAIDSPEAWVAAHWQRAAVATRPDDSGEGLPLADVAWFGYYYAGVFWKEDEHLNRLPNRPDRIYVDSLTGGLYIYSSVSETYARLVPLASSSTAGVAKLYDTLGSNEDGSVTQRKISGELAKKLEMDTTHLGSDERLDIFVVPS